MSQTFIERQKIVTNLLIQSLPVTNWQKTLLFRSYMYVCTGLCVFKSPKLPPTFNNLFTVLSMKKVGFKENNDNNGSLDKL